MDKYTDREFVEYLIKQIVNHPDDVVITRKTDEMGVLLEVKVNPQDMGMLIGRVGATAKAIRVLVRIIGVRNNERVNLRILEPDGGMRDPNKTTQEGTPLESIVAAPKEPSMRTLDSDSDIDQMMKDLQS